jgi:histone-lysine N-methyltransferase SETMAR
MHIDIIHVLGQKKIAYSTVTKYLRKRSFTSVFQEPPEEAPNTVIENAIVQALGQQPFALIREIAKLTLIPPTTVYRRLTQFLGFVVKHLHWVPHSINGAHKDQRAIMAKHLLYMLRSIKHQGWKFIVSIDESWFYLSTDHEQIWLRPDQAPPERPRHTIQDKKLMVTIVWNPLGFHIINALPHGIRFNADYYRDNILQAILPLRPAVGERNLVIHADNARPHTAQKCIGFCQENGLKFASHPPYSPDLAPSDFFLFGYIKHCLQGMTFQSHDELLEAIHEVVTAIEPTTLNAVFNEWMKRLLWVTQHNGEYYP